MVEQRRAVVDQKKTQHRDHKDELLHDVGGHQRQCSCPSVSKRVSGLVLGLLQVLESAVSCKI